MDIFLYVLAGVLYTVFVVAVTVKVKNRRKSVRPDGVLFISDTTDPPVAGLRLSDDISRNIFERSGQTITIRIVKTFSGEE